MLQAVHERRPSHNNAADVAQHASATQAKLLYYRLFAAAYRFAGGLTDAVMVNSSWTKNHLDALWALPPSSATSSATTVSDDGSGHSPVDSIWGSVARACNLARGAMRRPSSKLVFPPCNVDALASLPLGWTRVTPTAASPPCTTGDSDSGGSRGVRFATTRQRLVVSVAQFRPEKDHALQLRAFAEFRRRGKLCRRHKCWRDGWACSGVSRAVA